MTGTSFIDVILARGGDDVIHSLEGDGVICAGTGNDVVDAGEGDDRLAGFAGEDRLGDFLMKGRISRRQADLCFNARGVPGTATFSARRTRAVSERSGTWRSPDPAQIRRSAGGEPRHQ